MGGINPIRAALASWSAAATTQLLAKRFIS